MPSNNTLLEARGIGRRRPDNGGWLLEDASLTVSAGMRLSIVGPSGSGKTLLLRAMAMLDPLDSGEIRWQGRTVRREATPSFRKTVLYLHQRAALLEDTVEAAVRRPYGLAVHRRKSFDRDRVVDLLGQLGRDPAFLAKSVGDLSGGEIQITALVRAVQLDPTVLLLDEPTSALDPQTAAAVESLLGRWITDGPSGRAMLWVSHDAQQARRVSDRTMVMEGGRVVRSEEGERRIPKTQDPRQMTNDPIPNPQSPIPNPNPQSLIPNPQSPIPNP